MRHMRRRGVGLGYLLAVAAIHVGAIACLVSFGRAVGGLWGLGLLAYTFGLRHAFDVDHIAAIDNTVRKLVQTEEDPSGVGFYFSLGHATVVFLLVLALGGAAVWVEAHVPQMQRVGRLVGTSISGFFLLFIGALNLWILISFLRVLRRKKGRVGSDGAADALMLSRGLVARLAGPLFRLISKSRQVYFVGLLFGLGFDTATEVGLLALSAAAAGRHIPLGAILALPLLFAAGMSLMDSLDGMFMTWAYRWAFTTTRGRNTYNAAVTLVSATAALGIGGAELAGLFSGGRDPLGQLGSWLTGLSTTNLGVGLLGLLSALWLVFVVISQISKRRKYEQVSE